MNGFVTWQPDGAVFEMGFDGALAPGTSVLDEGVQIVAPYHWLIQWARARDVVLCDHLLEGVVAWAGESAS